MDMRNSLLSRITIYTNDKKSKYGKASINQPQNKYNASKTRHSGHTTGRSLQANISALEEKLDKGSTITETSPSFNELCAIIASASVPAPTGPPIPRPTTTMSHEIDGLEEKAFLQMILT